MKGYLRKIISYKMAEVNRIVMTFDFSENEVYGGEDFYLALKNRKRSLGIIAEFKRASPSAGWINENANLEEFLKDYDRFADAISILTDKEFFKGDSEYIRRGREVTNKPILAKDFVIDERQVYLFSKLGASAVLIIARILDRVMLKKLCELAESFGVLPFLEVYSIQDVEKVFSVVKPKLIAINNRDLETFKIDFFVFDKIYDYIKSKYQDEEILIVSASGVSCKEDVDRVKGRADAILVGSAIMKAQNRRAFLEELSRWCE
jgi:indole-3-glycerol phosphate synthase